MNVKELKETIQCSEVEVYELDPKKRYLIKVPQNISHDQLGLLVENLRKIDVKNVILVSGIDIRMYNLGEQASDREERRSIHSSEEAKS